MSLKVVAFDVYNTLARYPAARVRPIDVQRLLGRFGIPISYQAFEAARQAVFFFECLKRPIHGWTDFLALVFHYMKTPVSVDLLTSLTAMYESQNDMEIHLDAVPAMEAARGRGLVTCAFTTLPLFMIGRHAHELTSRLDHYFDASAVGMVKGDPRFYERITERLGVAPGEIIAVGDDRLCDVELPIEAGWRAVLLDRSGAKDPTAGEFATISSLSELDGLLKE